MKDTVVVYYSRTGKTRWVAEQLASILDADLEEIRERKDRSGFLGYLGAGKDAVLKREADLVSRHSVEGRKTVVIGMPVWGWGPPPAVRAYLQKVDLSGKRACAFATFDGSGGDRTLSAVGKLIPGGLAAALGLRKPQPGDPQLAARLREWAKQVIGG